VKFMGDKISPHNTQNKREQTLVKRKW